MINYEINSIQEFEVDRSQGIEEDFFRLIVDEDNVYFLPKLKFQLAEPLPQTLKVKIKSCNKGNLILAHFIPQYVKRFYTQGEEYEFSVISKPYANNKFFTLEDSYGIRYRLTEDKALLQVGQNIICKFTRIAQNFFELKRSDSSLRLPFISAKDFCDNIGVRPAMARLYIRNIHSLPEMADVATELCNKTPRWILTALHVALSELRNWFNNRDVRRTHSVLSMLINDMRNAGLYIIENSRFLRNLPESSRSSIQSIVTTIIENLKPYENTLKLVAEHKENSFVEELMEKLRRAGYLYHPVQQLSTLMLVFRTKPELVNKYLGGIFETIMEWPVETWTTEPFRSAFVDQLELYIDQACHEIDRLPLADTEEQVDKIEKIVTAIALQLLISGDTESSRARHNRSLFYRYVSLLRTSKNDDLLDKAFLTLMGINLPLEFKYGDIREPMMLMTKATVRPNDNLCTLRTTHSAIFGPVEIFVDEEGVAMRSSKSPSDIPVIPAGIMPWLSPMIFANNVKSLSNTKLKSLEAHHTLWQDIEQELFHNETRDLMGKRVKYSAAKGNVVKIVIEPEEMQRDADPIWRCRIDDEDYLPEEGFIRRSDIVTYRLNSNDLDHKRYLLSRALFDINNRPYHFLATVIDIEADGMLHFSLLDDVRSKVVDNCEIDGEYLAVITTPPSQDGKKQYSAICENGYGIYVQFDRNNNYRPGEYVIVRITDNSDPLQIKAEVVTTDTDRRLDKVDAFISMLNSVRLVSFDEEDDEEQLDPNTDFAEDPIESLSYDDVNELIELFRFKAISSSELLTAFDYLHFARLMALAIENYDVAERLNVHASLLRLHQYYATNNRIDIEQLVKMRPAVEGLPMLEIIYHRIEVVSWLDNPDRNPDLWNTINSPRNDLETSLARLVLSYNMLPKDSDADNELAKKLKKKIASLLGINFEQKTLKNYGSENQFIEFKSSIVYPARKNQDDKNEANPEQQQYVLLKIISSFMNSSGGTLYIGVNDASHCEAGLFEDFEYYKRQHNQAFINNYRFEMRTVDNFCTFLTNLVRFQWGTLVSESIQIDKDPEATRDVIIVKVEPRTLPVELDGKIFVRRSGSTMMLNEAEAREFTEERQALDYQNKIELPKVEQPAAAAEEAAEQSATAPKAKQFEPEATEITVAENAEPSLATSLWRPNVLHNWEDGFKDPAYYIYINRSHSLLYSATDLYCEEDYDLSLVVSEAETSGFLLLVFPNREALKIPIAEILEKPQNQLIEFFDAEPIFASIVTADQGLLVILTDSREGLYQRAIPVSQIDAAHLKSSPELIIDVNGACNIVACEVIAEEQLQAFDNSLSTKISARSIGYTMRCNLNSDKANSVIQRTINDCAPAK